MKLNIAKFQEGGAMPAAPLGAPVGGADPMQELMMAAQQAVEGQDCQMAMQVCLIILEMMGGGAPAAQGAEAAPAPAEGQPVFKKGGVMAYRVK